MELGFNTEYLTEATQLERRWGVPKNGRKRAILDGIKNNWDRKATAVLLENQALINELTTDTGDVAQFKRISIPLVRRIYPQLIANKIVTVQPLLGPTGLVYYLRFRYASNKGTTRGGTQAGFPGDDNLSLQQRASGDVNLDIYYSSQFVNQENQTNPGGGTSLQYQLEKTPILAGTLTGQIYDGSTLIYNFNINQAGTFTFTPIGAPAVTVTAGVLNPVTGVLTLTWSADPGANNIVVSYQQNLEGNQDLPEINMAVESEEVVARTRKLKASWTYEAQQDLRSQFNIDAEAELTAILAQEINLEIDREILLDLLNYAGTVSSWDFSTSLGDTIKEKYESLFVKITEVSNVIHRKTLRGAANWIVCSPEVASIFETSVAGFAPTLSDNFTSTLGIQYVGTINGRWRLFKDPFFPVSQILMGYKGDSYMDSGYYYCPYVPLTQTPVVLDPEGFVPRRGIMSRYASKLLRDGSKFYARISVNGFIA